MIHQKVLTIVSFELPESTNCWKAKCCDTSKEKRGLVQSENPGDIPY